MAINTTGYPNTSIDGNYPYNKAKDSSGATAKDGTPWKAELMNDLWGMWQALLVRSGITPSGVSDTANASDYADAIIQSMAKNYAVSASGTYTPSTTSLEDIVTVDTSGGNVTLTLAAVPFVGKKVTFLTSGSGLLYVKGPGVYVDAAGVGVPVNQQVTWKGDGSVWNADNVVCSDYISTDRIRQWSAGRMEQVGQKNFATSLTVVFPVAFSTVPEYANTITNTSASAINASFQLASATQIILQNTAGTPISQYHEAEGYY